MDIYENEKILASERGWKCFCGTDEAGRGPLAGPVYAAAVLLGEEKIDGLNDSKKLSEKKREKLYDEIVSKAAAWSVKSISSAEIEETDILSAAQKAMREAVSEVCSKIKCDGVLVDGNIARGFSIPAAIVVGGDASCASIAAASILAKVSRDRELVRLDSVYPGYGFAKHKGYGTKEHYAALDRMGPCPEHRMSFLKKYFQRKEPAKPTKGQLGESIALDYLISHGWRLLERNYHTRFGEIDLIVENGEYLSFVEVKLRNSSSFAKGEEYVDIGKRRRIKTAAEEWLMQYNGELIPRFDVIVIYPPQSSRDTEYIEHIENAFDEQDT